MCTEQGRHVPRERGRWMIRGRSCVYRTRKACASGEGEMDDPREELCVQNKERMCLGRGGEMDDPREELCVQNKEGMCLGRGGRWMI